MPVDATGRADLLHTRPERILGELAGGIAHDLNNLLGVILNFTTLISRRVDDPAVTADLGEIRTAAERGAALTRQLLGAIREVLDG